MDDAKLDRLVAKYTAAGLADSTRRAYSSSQRRYLEFCRRADYTVMPATQQVLCKFASQLADEGLKHTTIKAYMSGVRHLHIAEGLQNPFQEAHPQLDLLMRGIAREESRQPGRAKPRLPITPNILRKIKGVWGKAAQDPDTTMMWAACCVAYYGFLRAGEFTVPSDNGYDPGAHLGKRDVAFNRLKKPSMMRVTIRQSKTDPFRKGIELFIGRTATDLCPVEAMLQYLLVRRVGEGPLFWLADGKPLTRSRFVDRVRGALAEAGLKEAEYGGHSFRIGAATTAAEKGLGDALIKTLGRWRSRQNTQCMLWPPHWLQSVPGCSPHL